MKNNEDYTLLKEVINDVDPIGLIDIDTPESLDEYNSELNEIFKEDISSLDSQKLSELIHSVFIKFFNEELAGTKEKYSRIANKYLDLAEKKEGRPK